MGMEADPNFLNDLLPRYCAFVHPFVGQIIVPGGLFR